MESNLDYGLFNDECSMLMGALGASLSKHLVDEHFTCIRANEYYYKLIGYPKEKYEALFHNHPDEYYANNPEGWAMLTEKVMSTLEQGKDKYEAIIPMKYEDGSTRWVKMMGFFTGEYQDGWPLAYTTMVDVTDLMQAKQEKTIAYDNIPGFIVKYRILADKIIMTGASDRITEVFNVDPDNLESFDPYAILHPESRAMIEANHPHFRRGKPFEGTIGAIDKYGRDRWFHIHCTCIDAIADDPAYLTVFIDVTDVTELRKLQKKLEEHTDLLNAALEAAKQANAAKSDFLSRMSHDIRTPMNAIAGMTEIADAHLEDPKRVRDCLQKIRLSSRHLLGLVNDVLDMSKIESGKFPLHIAPFSLRETLREVAMITMAGVRERRQSFDVRLIHMEQEQFYCDALRLRQILLNLLSNAVKFTPVEGRIVLTAEQLPQERPEEAALRFTVIDTGPGMKPEFLEHLFEAFTREQDSRTDRIEGSGLGMAIAKRLTDLLDGAISVESSPGVGTTFQVTLPMRPVFRQSEDTPAPGARILLAGSDAATLHCDEEMLRALGVDAEVANGCRIAADLVEDGEDYDLILLDCGVPCQNVLQSLRRIRKVSRNVQLKLVLSAYDWSDIQDEVLAAGADGFIEKPIFPSTLRECLRTYLQAEARPEQESSFYDFRGKKFLLVEDNEINREIALELIGSFGASLETAADGQEAVCKFKESPPFSYDLILMDIQMPVMNGYEATRAIRMLPREDAKTIPIIAMTADAFVEDIQNAGDAGMNGHLSKPLDFGSLAGEISRYLRGAAR